MLVRSLKNRNRTNLSFTTETKTSSKNDTRHKSTILYAKNKMDLFSGWRKYLKSSKAKKKGWRNTFDFSLKKIKGERKLKLKIKEFSFPSQAKKFFNTSYTKVLKFST